MKSIDPAAMSPDERLAELGDILAAGIQRFLAREGKAIRASQDVQDHLDVLAGSEAPCGPPSETPR